MRYLDGVKVLLVEDEPDTREMLRTALEGQGAIVTCVGSAADALAEVERAAPDVVISDIAMPGEDGHAFMRQLLAYGALVIASIDNVLKPLILSGTTEVHTLLAFVFLVGGLATFGLAGLIVGPVMLSLVVTAYGIYRYEILRWAERRPAE